MLYLASSPKNAGHYKSFKILSYSTHAPTGQPSHLEIRRYKKYVDLRVHTGWFSESRGTGSTTNRRAKIEDAEVLERVDAMLTRPAEVTGLFPLLDTIAERLPDLPLLPLIQRWFVLAQQKNPSRFVDDENRERALTDKKFSVGDLVLLTGYGNPCVYRILTERFESQPYHTHTWRYSVRGAELSQDRIRRATDADLVAMDGRLEAPIE